MGGGLWRYSLAAMIVVAALLDVLWWVPAHREPPAPGAVREPARFPVGAEMVRCRKAQLEREIADRQAELQTLE
jgi:hypothetical protein